MDLNNFESENLSKKSSANLLKIIAELKEEDTKYRDQIIELFDKQDAVFELYKKIMKIITQRSHN